MPFAIPALLSGIAGLAGGLNNRPGTTTSTETGTNTTNTSQSGTETPVYSTQQQQLLNNLIPGFQNLLKDPNLTGYQASGLAAINKGNNARQTAISNILASRGLSYSPAAGATLAAGKNAGVDQAIQFSNSIPLLAKQLQAQNLSTAGNFFNSMKTGSKFNTTGTSTQNINMTGKTTTPGNILGGAVGGIGGMLAYLYGKGAFGGGSNGGGGGGGIGSLAGLFGGGGSSAPPGFMFSDNAPNFTLPANNPTSLMSGDMPGGFTNADPGGLPSWMTGGGGGGFDPGSIGDILDF